MQRFSGIPEFMVKGEEIHVKEDHAVAELPLRILGDEELFAEYVKNLAGKHPSTQWGPSA